MLKKRLLTAIPLVVLVLVALNYLPVGIIVFLVSVLTILLFWEWRLLLEPKKRIWNLFEFLVFGCFLLFSTLLDVHLVLSFALFWTLLVTVLLVIVSRGKPDFPKIGKRLFFLIFRRFAPYATLIPFWYLTNFLIAYVDKSLLIGTLGRGRSLFIFLLLIVWATDTGGYLFGSSFQGRSYVSTVSPKKSDIGYFGSFFVAWLVASLASPHFLPTVSLYVVFCLTVIVVVLAVIGDLFESLLKRFVDRKEISNLLPGHGGMLDRVDGLLFAGPFYFILLLVFRIITI